MLQVHDERDPLHVRDAASLWHDPPAVHGFDDRARIHTALALREAAAAWPPLERLLEQRVPDELTLDTDDLVSLLDDGVAALRAVGVDVLWPRSLGRDLVATATLDRAPGTREGQLVDGVLSGDALFAFNWQVALRGDPLTEREMDQLAQASSPMLRLRGGWTVVDPAIARKARKRLIRTVPAAQAVAAALTGVVDVEDAPAEVVVGASLLAGARAAARRRDGPAAADRRPAWPRPCATTSATASPGSTRLTSMGLGRLPGRRHGAGQDRHPDRAPPPPAPASRRSDAGGLPDVPARQLGGRGRALRARGRRTPVPRR